MRTFAFSLLLLCVLCLDGAARPQEFNGVNWSRLDSGRIEQKVRYSVKLSYIMGLLSSHEARMLYVIHRKENVALPASDTSLLKPEEIVRLVDHFYKDGRNLNIPLSRAFVIACAKLNGVDQTAVDSAVQGLQGQYGE